MTAMLLLAAALFAPGATDVHAVAPAAAAPVAVMAFQEQPTPPADPPKIDVTITEKTTETVWYLEPIWLAIGGLAILLILVLVVLAARGGSKEGGTTIVK